jgi:tetratricopeptide (TPR) repeat protein
MRTAYVSLAAFLLLTSTTLGKAGLQDHPQEAVKPSESSNRQAPVNAGQSSDSQASDPKASANKPGIADYSHEPIVYEYLHHELRYENDGTGTLDIHGRIRVQTPAGLTKAGQLVFNYNAANEKIEVRSVRVEKPDGTVVNAGPENVQDLSAPVAREAPIYTDARQKHVTVPSLSIGDIVDYDAVVTSQPVMATQFWRTESLISDAICLDEQVNLNVPRERQVKFAIPPDTESTVEDVGDRHIYHWKRSVLTISEAKSANKNTQIDAKRMLEGFRPLLPPNISFSTFQSWSEVGKWYADLERERRIPTSEIRAKADEIVIGKTTDLEKAEALYNWVSANIRYVSLSFGVGRYQPHAASEVLANRYGDCKDKGTLLEAFFAAQGLHAQAALINSGADLNERVPTPGQFDHLITFAQVAGKDIWLDSTIGVGPFGYLLPQLRGKQALVATVDAIPALQKTPENLTTPILYRVDVQGDVNKDLKLDAKINLETRGDLEVLFRIWASSLSTTQLNAFAPLPMTAALKATYAAKFTDFVVDDAADTAKPLHVRFHFVGNLQYVDMKPTSRETFLVALNQALFQKEGLLALLPGAEANIKGSGKIVPSGGKIGGPKEYSLSLAITVPTVKVDDLEKPQTAQFINDAAEYDASANWDGQTLHASWKLNLRIPELPLAQATEYFDFCKSVVGSIDFEMPKEKTVGSAVASETGSTPKPGTTPTPAPKPVAPVAPAASKEPILPVVRPHAEEVHNLYEQGRDEAKKQNYANAVESFTEAVKLDSENPAAWRELGRAQMYLRNYTDAESDFRKYLALAPDDHLAYLNMAWVLYDEKKYTEEVDMLEKRIANTPNDGDADARLGAAYLALHQPEKALPVLQNAVSVFPRYEYPQFNLARAYLQLHQDDSAAAEFQRAIKLDDSSNTQNSAAYALADAKTHLEIAAMWSDSAIEAVGLELNQTKFPLQAAAMRRVSSLAAYWDTMGWIKFQQGSLESAEKYVRAGAELADDSTILYHLGRINEAQGRKSEAIEAYAETVASMPATRAANDDEKDARTRLDALLGDFSLVDERVKQSRPKLKERRSVSIPNLAGLEGVAQYTVIIGSGSKVIDLEPMNPDDALAGLKDAVNAATMPQSFPDNTIQKLPRVGALSCPRAELPCTFTFTPAGAAARVVTAD